MTYWWDKDSAKAKGRRTRETTLHLFDLAFGIVGGLLAQQVLRHKTSKAGFIAMTIAIFAVHMLALLAFILMPALSAFGR